MNPGPVHWTVAQCVVNYLYMTKHKSLVLGGSTINLKGWVDSDWGACINSHHFISSYAFSLGTGLVSWS